MELHFIEKKLKDIYSIISTINDETFNPSLLDGSFSKVLFLAQYDALNNGNDVTEITIEQISKLFDYVEHSLQKVDETHSFHTGVQGALWLLNYIEKSIKFIEIDEAAKRTFSNYCFKSALDKFRVGYFDLFIGGIGSSMTLIEGHETDKLNLLKKVLLRTSHKKEGNTGIYWQSTLLDGSGGRGEYLGLAHGAASILSFMSITKAIEKDNKEDEMVCSEIISNILSHKRTKSLVLFPSQVSGANTHQNLRLAWCHGDLGIAAAIFNAGVTFNNQEWLNEAYDILHHIYTKRTDLEQNGIYDANVCHGAAGVAHVFNKVYHYSKIPEFKDATDLWIGHILTFAKYDDGLAGFKTYDNEKGLINSTGLLTGISGIGLVLLSYLYPETVNTWDRCLLLS